MERMIDVTVVGRLPRAGSPSLRSVSRSAPMGTGVSGRFHTEEWVADR